MPSLGVCAVLACADASMCLFADSMSPGCIRWFHDVLELRALFLSRVTLRASTSAVDPRSCNPTEVLGNPFYIVLRGVI